jgi:hypothetical protein
MLDMEVDTEVDTEEDMEVDIMAVTVVFMTSSSRAF